MCPKNHINLFFVKWGLKRIITTKKLNFNWVSVSEIVNMKQENYISTTEITSEKTIPFCLGDFLKFYFYNLTWSNEDARVFLCNKCYEK